MRSERAAEVHRFRAAEQGTAAGPVALTGVTPENHHVAMPFDFEPLAPEELECVGGHGLIDAIAGCFIIAEDDWESPGG